MVELDRAICSIEAVVGLVAALIRSSSLQNKSLLLSLILRMEILLAGLLNPTFVEVCVTDDRPVEWVASGVNPHLQQLWLLHICRVRVDVFFADKMRNFLVALWVITPYAFGLLV